MFAVFLALVCAMIFAAAMPTAAASRAKANNYNLAINIAQRQMEALKAVDPALRADQLVAAGLIDSATPIAPNTWSFRNVGQAGNDAARQVLKNGRAEVQIDVLDVELRQVTVRVIWEEQGQDRDVTLSTLVADLNN